MNPDEILARINAVPENKEGEKWKYALEYQQTGVQKMVRYSNEILPVFEILEGVTAMPKSVRAFRYVAIIKFPAECFCRMFDGDEQISHGDLRGILDAVEKEKECLKAKASLPERGEPNFYPIKMF